MYTVMVEIAAQRGDTFSSKLIADGTRLSRGIVHLLIQKLLRARWIEFVQRVAGERTILYRVRENPWWTAASCYIDDGASLVEHKAS